MHLSACVHFFCSSIDWRSIITSKYNRSVSLYSNTLYKLGIIDGCGNHTTAHSSEFIFLCLCNSRGLACEGLVKPGSRATMGMIILALAHYLQYRSAQQYSTRKLYLLKNSQAAKKDAALCKMAKKSREKQMAAKNGCVNDKNFYNGNLGKFVLSHPKNWHKNHLNSCY